MRNYINDYPCFDITAIGKQFDLSKTQYGNTTCKINGFDDRVRWAFGWMIEKHVAGVRFQINETRYERHAKIINHSNTLGGFDKFLECPTCEAKRKQLYIFNTELACRKCHNLHYKCQSETENERRYRKILKLLDKVEPIGQATFDPYIKEKWQRWPTFEKISSDLEKVKSDYFQHIYKVYGFKLYE